MARFAVTPEQLVAQAVRLSTVPGQLNGAGASLAGAAGAAHDTRAAGELDGAVKAWMVAIGQDAVATAGLAGALVGAASAYVAADRLRGAGGG
ncbi:MAG: hypothetical protein QOJ85_2720 [Solirubrobacteraceae bacterium]|jgi:hypothetical protein|nr:hypothetical protein [Solirubrobacteraceae bacterium]